MSKINKLLVVLVFVILCFPLLGCTTYNCDITDDGWIIGYSKIQKNSFVGCYTWDGNLDNADIVIPDQYKEYLITKIGGYYGTGFPIPFYIDLPDRYEIESFTTLEPKDTPDWYLSGYEIEYIDFTLRIGANIQSIDYVLNPYFMHKNLDGSYILYQVRYYIDCHLDNKTFYSNKGMLYHKLNDKIVKEFKYYD